MAAPGEMLETQRGSPMASAETPAVTQPREQDPHPEGPGTVLEDQIPKGESLKESPFLPLPKRSSSNGGANAEEEAGPGAEPLTGPNLATRDWGDETVGTTDFLQETDPGAGKPEPGKDPAAKGSGGTEVGSRMPTAAEAAIMVLGK